MPLVALSRPSTSSEAEEGSWQRSRLGSRLHYSHIGCAFDTVATVQYFVDLNVLHHRLLLLKRCCCCCCRSPVDEGVGLVLNSAPDDAVSLHVDELLEAAVASTRSVAFVDVFEQNILTT